MSRNTMTTCPTCHAPVPDPEPDAVERPLWINEPWNESCPIPANSVNIANNQRRYALSQERRAIKAEAELEAARREIEALWNATKWKWDATNQAWAKVKPALAPAAVSVDKIRAGNIGSDRWSLFATQVADNFESLSTQIDDMKSKMRGAIDTLDRHATGITDGELRDCAIDKRLTFLSTQLDELRKQVKGAQ